MQRSRAVRGAVALVVTAAVVVHTLTHDPLSTAIYLGALVGASVAAWIGAERAPRGQHLVPRLIAVGLSLTALGDALWSILDAMGIGTDVSLADPPWFASYVVLCAALSIVLGQSRLRSGLRIDLGFVIDAVTIVIVSVLIFWSVTVNSIIADHSVTPFVRTVWASYPIADAVLLALVLRVLMNRSARGAIGASFAVGTGLWLAADVAYLESPGGATILAVMDACWMVAPVLMASAAWRTRDLRPDAPASLPVGGWVPQLMIAVAPLFVPTALEVVADLRSLPDHPLQLFLGTLVLTALAFIRTARLIRSEQGALRELEAARDAALEASRAKSMFLANMSHEIRTPLTTVLATAEILEDTTLDALQLDLLGRMNRSGDLLKKLVEGILDFSRIEAGRLELTLAPFDLDSMVADAADVYALRADQAGVTFEWHVDPCVPHTVIGDSARLFQVVSNLLDNALKFTQQGTVSLRVRCAEGDRAGGVMEFVVTDTGIGIGPDNLESVWDSFSQVDGSTTRRFGGSGLGLAICQDLVELMGGSISVESQLGLGSTFTLRVPLVQFVREPIAPHPMVPDAALPVLTVPVTG